MGQQRKEDCVIETCEVSKNEFTAQAEGPGKESSSYESQNRDVMSEEDEVLVDLDND